MKGFIQDILVGGGGGEKFMRHCHSVVHEYEAIQILKFSGKELRLHDKWAESCVPSGGAIVNPDPTGRRNGQGGSFLCPSTVR